MGSSRGGGGGGGGGGVGTAESEYDFLREQDPSAPHWDRIGHFRTHEGIRRRAEERRRMVAEREVREQEEATRGLLIRFVFVGGVVTLVAGLGLSLPGMVFGGSSDAKTRRSGVRGREGEG
jgi:hypothetical protein